MRFNSLAFLLLLSTSGCSVTEATTNGKDDVAAIASLVACSRWMAERIRARETTGDPLLRSPSSVEKAHEADRLADNVDSWLLRYGRER